MTKRRIKRNGNSYKTNVTLSQRLAKLRMNVIEQIIEDKGLTGREALEEALRLLNQ